MGSTISGHLEASEGYTRNLKVVHYIAKFVIPKPVILGVDAVQLG